MPRNNRDNSKPSSKDSRDETPDLLGSFSRSIDKFDDSSQRFGSIYEDNTTRLIKAMESVVKAFEKDIDDFEDILNDGVKGQTAAGDKLTKDVSGVLQGTSKDIENQGKAFAQTVGSSLKMVADYAIGKLEGAFDKIVDNYNANFTAITVRMNQSAGEYTKMLQDSTEFIRDNNLVTQFSQIDWTSAMTEALSTGLRGEYAQQLATQTMISEKLLPQVTTTTKAYTRMSKLIGNEFNKATTAIGKYTEEVYGAEGLEDNQVNELMETTYREIAASVAERGGTKEEFAEIWSNTIGTYQQYANQYGSEYATQMLSDYKDYLTGSAVTDNNTAALAIGQNAGLMAGDSRQVNADTMAQFFKAGSEFYSQYAGETELFTFGGIGQYNMYLDQMIGDYFGDTLSDWDKIQKGYNEEYAEEMAELSQGKYQNLTDQQAKFNENLVANIGDKAAQYLPDVSGSLDLIKGLVSTWFSAWLMSGGGSGGGALSNFASTGVGQKFFTTGEGGAVTGLTSGSALSGVGALSIASMVAGGIWGIADGSKAVSTAKANDASKSEQAGDFFGGFLTGRETIGMTEDQKAQYYQQHGTGIDWGDAVENAAKWGLIGAGAGTAIGGWALGTGTVVGGLGGAAAGFLGSVVDQYQDKKFYKELAEAAESASESLAQITDAGTQFETTMSRATDSTEALEIMQNQGSYTQEEVNQAFLTLKDNFPSYLGNMDDVSEWDASYVEIIKNKIEQEKLAARNAIRDSATGTSVDVSANKETINAASAAFARAIDSGEITTRREAYDFADAYGKQHNMTREEVLRMYSSAFGSDVVVDHGDDDIYFNTSFISEFDGKNSNGTNTGGQVVDATRVTNQLSRNDEAIESLKSQWDSVIQPEYLNLKEVYLSGTAEGASEDDIQSNKDLAGTVAADLHNKIDSIASNARGDWYQEVKSRIKGLTDLETYYKFAGYTGGGDHNVGFYRQGTDRTHEGLAYLHDNEAVLTATSASQLRALADGSLSSYIDGVYQGSKVSQGSAVGDVNSSNLSSLGAMIVAAIEQQTSVMSEYLSQILLNLGRSSKDTSTTVSHDRNLVTYNGVGSATL